MLTLVCQCSAFSISLSSCVCCVSSLPIHARFAHHRPTNIRFYPFFVRDRGSLVISCGHQTPLDVPCAAGKKEMCNYVNVKIHISLMDLRMPRAPMCTKIFRRMARFMPAHANRSIVDEANSFFSPCLSGLFFCLALLAESTQVPRLTAQSCQIDVKRTFFKPFGALRCPSIDFPITI